MWVSDKESVESDFMIMWCEKQFFTPKPSYYDWSHYCFCFFHHSIVTVFGTGVRQWKWIAPLSVTLLDGRVRSTYTLRLCSFLRFWPWHIRVRAIRRIYATPCSGLLDSKKWIDFFFPEVTKKCHLFNGQRARHYSCGQIRNKVSFIDVGYSIFFNIESDRVRVGGTDNNGVWLNAINYFFIT